MDFSSFNVLAHPVVERLVVNQDGHFARQDESRKSLHFLMASMGFSTFPSHEMADVYAKQIRMHGYNMARLDFIEQTLMNKRMSDFDFNQEQLDRLYRKK